MNTEIQGSLFEETRTMSRQSDPVTSHMAAVEMVVTGKKEGHQILVMNLVEEFPCCTYRELFTYHCQKRDSIFTEVTQVGRRLKELETLGTVRRTPRRTCRIGKSIMTTWEVTEKASG